MKPHRALTLEMSKATSESFGYLIKRLIAEVESIYSAFLILYAQHYFALPRLQVRLSSPSSLLETKKLLNNYLLLIRLACDQTQPHCEFLAKLMYLFINFDDDGNMEIENNSYHNGHYQTRAVKICHVMQLLARGNFSYLIVIESS